MERGPRPRCGDRYAVVDVRSRRRPGGGSVGVLRCRQPRCRRLGVARVRGGPRWPSHCLGCRDRSGRLGSTDYRPGKAVHHYRRAAGRGGNVIIGNGGAEYGVRGYVTAYDAETGAQGWRFYTVPGNPSEPFEHPELETAAETWTGEWWEVGGGGTAWDSMAYDPELDLLYVGVGNGSPWTRLHRSPDGGDNLYLSSIIALRPDTGRLVWHYQTTPGDNWDYTATQHIMLADVEIDGRERQVLMQAPKNGFFYVLDRATGS